MSNDYWDGTTLAHLERRQIAAPWGSGSFSGERINFANELFEFWYDSRQNIARCTDSAHRSAMTEELEDAGYTGAGLFIDDLDEAFEHIHRNGGRWTDDTASYTYFGGPDKVFRRGGLISDMPKPFVKFADAVDDKFQVVRSAMNDFNQRTRTVDQQLASSRTNWDQIGIALTHINNWGQRVQPFLWARPRASRAVGRTVSFANALGNIHSGVTSYERARQAHFPQGQAAAIGLLRTAVGFVPVLGNYYGGMVDLIPNLRTWFSNLIEERVRRIDRACSGRP